jgi:PST family polysaccharide transporter
MIWGVVSAAFASVAFVAGIAWGALGVAIAYAISEYLKTVPLWRYISRRGPVRGTDALRSCGPLVLAGHIALATVWLAQDRFVPSPVAGLAEGLVLSYLVFGATALVFRSGRTTLREAADLIAAPLRRRSPAA